MWSYRYQKSNQHVTDVGYIKVRSKFSRQEMAAHLHSYCPQLVTWPQWFGALDFRSYRKLCMGPQTTTQEAMGYLWNPSEKKVVWPLMFDAWFGFSLVIFVQPCLVFVKIWTTVFVDWIMDIFPLSLMCSCFCWYKRVQYIQCLSCGLSHWHPLSFVKVLKPIKTLVVYCLKYVEVLAPNISWLMSPASPSWKKE